jgi:hypothetical protein
MKFHPNRSQQKRALPLLKLLAARSSNLNTGMLWVKIEELQIGEIISGWV